MLHISLHCLTRGKADILKTSKSIIEMLVKPVSVKALIERVRQALD